MWVPFTIWVAPRPVGTMFLALEGPTRPGSSLVVFGNGRTHTGEVDGSGGSRLANYCLRASTSTPSSPKRRNVWRNMLAREGMSEWLTVVKGGVRILFLTLRTPASELLWLCEGHGGRDIDGTRRGNVGLSRSGSQFKLMSWIHNKTIIYQTWGCVDILDAEDKKKTFNCTTEMWKRDDNKDTSQLLYQVSVTYF